MKHKVKRALAAALAGALLAGLMTAPVHAAGRKIDVWDFTGQTEADTGVYTSHITPAAWVESGAMADGVLSNGTEAVFGDLSMTHNANDRIYSAVESADWGGILGGNAQNKYGHAYDDGYEAQGGWYCNGAGGESKRFIVLSNVEAGDKIEAYMGSASGDIVFHFDALAEGADQAETVTTAASEFGRFEFIAQYSGAYKLWTDPAGKAMFHRLVRSPGAAVTGSLLLPGDFKASGYALKFVNQQTRQETAATLNADNTFSVTLAAGYTYNAALTGATGWGFTAGTRQVVTTPADAVGGKSGVRLEVEAKSTYPYTGKVTGFAPGYDLSKLALTMVPEEGSGSEEVALTLSGTDFQGVLDPSVSYTIRVEGANDYVVKTPAAVTSEGLAYAEDIVMEAKTVYPVSGTLLGGTATALRFENVEDGYVYDAQLSGQSYTAQLRSGAYLAHAEAADAVTGTHVVVAGKAAEKDILLVSTLERPAVEWAGDIYVGCPGKEPNYETVRDAVDAASRMGIAGEEQRVTVHIAPGTYREQVIVGTPYLSFVNADPSGGEVLLTWYYGIGYQYYSAGPDGSGYYDAQRAFDKYDKHTADRWGTAVRILPAAVGFRAQGITFENSFNRYITDEELSDGVEPSGETLKAPRNYSADVTGKALTERAAALCVEAPECEFYRCAFLSSQDTLYTAATAYFKHCLIEGQTDYIFGSGNVVFDGCELRWKGYSDAGQGGYITAQRSEKEQKGYLFRGCTVTASSELEVAPGCFGRPWGADAAVRFQDTWLEDPGLITPAGWTEMSGNKPENARFAESFTREVSTGDPADTSQRVAASGPAPAAAVADYLGAWTPHYYTQEVESVTFASDPIITDNGDINLPKAGHTLTVGWSLGANDASDVSVIRWYRVAADGTETLIKAATANVSRSYKIQREDLDCRIKAEVTPATLSGQTGEAKSYTLIETVKEGWNDPGAAPGDVVVGEGINIFLAGDSTVKDYSAKGMYNDGKNQLEGSWGEWLQSFLDPAQVTVVNYAQGGRSTRNFINEGSLDKIAAKIGAGDYLFIQFGHNDASNADQSHLTERHAPLGEPDENGVYPSTPGVKAPTPAGLPASWGEECYTWDCGGTYKWYLQQYIDVARAAGAVPVLVTPVARMYYQSDGTIKPHHDESTAEVKSNAYCAAVRQLAQEQDVLLIDAFALTEEMFIDAWKAGGERYGQQTMCVGESTHSNKLGGMMEAALVAQAIQGLDVNISRAVKAPAKVLGETAKGETAFTVNAGGVFTAWDMLSGYTENAGYWTGWGQSLFDAIAAKAETLGRGTAGFADVPAGHWAEAAINAMADQGILQGVDADRRLFGLTAPVTRASVAVILWRLAGAPDVSGGDDYSDVADGMWYTGAVRWAAGQGIVQGRGDGTFGPDDPVTREQLAVMLYRELQKQGGGFEGMWMFPLDFVDANEVSGWADEAMHYMTMKQIIRGKDGGRLDPQGTVTRAEAAVMLERFVGEGR